MKESFLSPPDNCRSILNPISSAGWFVLTLNGPKSNNTFGMCQILVPHCLFPPVLKKQEHRFWETTEGWCDRLQLFSAVPLEWKEARMPSYLRGLYVYIAHRMSCYAYVHTHKSVFGLCKCALATAALQGCMHVHTWWQLAWTLQSCRHCDDLSLSSTFWCHWLKYHMEWHMPFGTELTCLPACLPAQGKAAGQSHFQKINLIWECSLPCNLKQ